MVTYVGHGKKKVSEIRLGTEITFVVVINASPNFNRLTLTS